MIMKKAILSAVVLAATAGIASAQFSIAPEVGVSIYNNRGKVQTTSFVGTSTESKSVSADPTFGIKGGVNAKYGLTSRVSLQAGIFYVGKGYKDKNDISYTVPGTTTTVTQKNENKISIDYLELPINVQYNVHDKDGAGIFVFAGPYLGYAFGGKEKMNTHITTNGVTVDNETTRNLDIGSDDSNDGVLPKGDDWKAFDYGAQIGVGYTLPIGLYFRAQYQMGFADVRPNDLGNSTLGLPKVDYNQKNWGFAVTAGYWLFNNNK